MKSLIDTALIGGRTIDNSHVVREVDPRQSRNLWGVLLLVLALAGAVGVYAWPHVAARQTSQAAAHLQRQRDRLAEENRKLRLEKARLEDLHRVEKIAVELGLQPPPPERVVVVERRPPAPRGAQVAEHREGAPLPR